MRFDVSTGGGRIVCDEQEPLGEAALTGFGAPAGRVAVLEIGHGELFVTVVDSSTKAVCAAGCQHLKSTPAECGARIRLTDSHDEELPQYHG